MHQATVHHHAGHDIAFHIHRGALGAFLRAIESGQIDPSSLLVIEVLDRLSWAEPIEAQTLPYKIITVAQMNCRDLLM